MKEKLNGFSLEGAWQDLVGDELQKPYMVELEEFLAAQRKAGKNVYPSKTNIFNAFATTPFNEVKVCIVGQDPYHGSGQAHGYCFSVPPGIKIPPSLRNIYKEIETDIGKMSFESGCLLGWAKQGVLLLNSVLSVEEGKAGSHQGKGWEQFTNCVISLLNERHSNIVFLLWGNYAKQKGAQINRERHLVLESVHPSPLSAYNGFFGCRHFSQANSYLIDRGVKPIDWSGTN